MTLISPHQWGKVVQPGLSACNAQAGRVLLGASFGLCPRIFGRSPIDVEGSLSVRPSLTAHRAAKPQDQGCVETHGLRCSGFVEYAEFDDKSCVETHGLRGSAARPRDHACASVASGN
jgi:hypothetical protein